MRALSSNTRDVKSETERKLRAKDKEERRGDRERFKLKHLTPDWKMSKY